MPTGCQCTVVVSMRVLGKAAATEKETGFIAVGHSEDLQAQAGPFGGSLFFLRIRCLGEKMKAPALLTDRI